MSEAGIDEVIAGLSPEQKREEAKSIETTHEVVEGMQFDKGYLSPICLRRKAANA